MSASSQQRMDSLRIPTPETPSARVPKHIQEMWVPAARVQREAPSVHGILDRRPINGYSPTTALANILGIAIALSPSLEVDGVVFSATREIDEERRQKLGYGNLPAALVWRVEREVSPLMPDSMDAEVGLRVCAQVMHIGMADPTLHRAEIDAALAVCVETGQLSLPSPASEVTVAAINGAIDRTYELTVHYQEAYSQQ